MDYKNKYLKYKTKYNNLKYKNEIYNFIGGACQQDKKFHYDDISSVLDYVKNRYECTDNKKTTRKYFVILYGPPASGKTISRKLACAYIKKHFDEQLSSEDIHKSFIDTGVDDIVYDAYYNEESPQISVKDKLKNTIDAYFEKIYIKKDERFDYLKKNIDTDQELKKIVDNNIGIYRKYRNDRNIDDISALLGIIGTYTNHNVFFEIASPYIDYINKLIGTIYWNNYNIVFIYPYTDNTDLLVDRNFFRGLNEGRILTRELIDSKKEQCFTAFNQKVIDKSNPQSMYNLYKNIMILRYDTDLTLNLYSKLNKYDIDEFETSGKVYEFEIKKT